MNTRPWSEVQDDLFGERGTPRREEIERAVEALERRDVWAHRLTDWLDIFGPIGRVAARFWYWTLTEGDPRDGMKWSFLNDGYGRPRLWYVWAEMRGEQPGHYLEGAPAQRPRAES